MKPRTDRILLMLAALGLALLLWFIVGAEERSEMVVSVPLEYRNIPRGHEILNTGDLVTQVNVWIRGSTADIKELEPKEISVWLDLQSAKKGQEVFEISTDNVRVPYGFSVLRISPAQIRLKIERIVTRLVQVQPYLVGMPAEGFAVSQYSVSPPQVEIAGPESAADSLRHAITEPIDVAGKKGTSVASARVSLNNAALRLGKVKEVRVTLQIEEIRDVRTFRQVPLTLENVSRGLEVRYNPKTVKIDLQAPKMLLERLDPKRVRALLDLEGLKPGIYELTPKIVLDVAERDNIGVAAVTPPRIHLKIL